MKILFYPDFDEPYPIWRAVLDEYLEKFKGSDQVSLLLRVKRDDGFDERMENIQSIFSKPGELADIIIVDDSLENERRAFAGMDYFVTDRSGEVVNRVEMADADGVKIISGVDRPVFDRSEILEKTHSM